MRGRIAAIDIDRTTENDFPLPTGWIQNHLVVSRREKDRTQVRKLVEHVFVHSRHPPGAEEHLRLPKRIETGTELGGVKIVSQQIKGAGNRLDGLRVVNAASIREMIDHHGGGLAAGQAITLKIEGGRWSFQAAEL